MTVLIILIVFIALWLFLASKTSNTDEGVMAAFFGAAWLTLAWGSFGFGALLMLVGIFA
jgi:hypothetical protein